MRCRTATLLGVLPLLVPASIGTPLRTQAQASAWRDRFEVDKARLLPTGNNPYISMQPGRVLTLKHGSDTLTITVLDETQDVDGVRSGILEERETKGGALAEISRNFLATDRTTGMSTTSARTWTITATARWSATTARGAPA